MKAPNPLCALQKMLMVQIGWYLKFRLYLFQTNTRKLNFVSLFQTGVVSEDSLSTDEETGDFYLNEMKRDGRNDACEICTAVLFTILY